MNLLLDPHALLWYITGDSKIPRHVIEQIQDGSNHCFVSIASIWEISIKLSLDKLVIDGGFETIRDFFDHNDFELLPIDFEDAMEVLNLTFHHRDPFDRMLIAQAKTSGMIIVSKDEAFKAYGVITLW